MEVIATVTNVETAERLFKACPPDYFRVNASHMTADTLGAFCKAYSLVEGMSNIPLYIDLQGSKLRVHRIQPQVSVSVGDHVNLVRVEENAESIPEHSEGISIYVTENIMRLINAGTEVGIDDGKILLTIESITEDRQRAVGVVHRGGVVRPRKGFNLRPHPITFTSLSARDRENVKATRDFKFVRYALSFACLPSEVAELQELAGADKFIAVKLERPLEDDATVALCNAAKELWLCRGDMGAQLGAFGELSVFYRHFITETLPRLLGAGCRVIMAGEVLDHMCGAEEPTRSEICHLGDIYANGFVGIVVSNETAYGKYPVEVLKTFREISSRLEAE